jgi:hypothetical protein
VLEAAVLDDVEGAAEDDGVVAAQLVVDGKYGVSWKYGVSSFFY